MAFQIKSFVSIVASMVNYARATTTLFSDYNPGSKARTMLEAPALEMEELYQQMANGLIEAIPTSVYLTFNFQLLPATVATFPMQVALVGNPAAQTISAGTLFTRADQGGAYLSVADVPVAANQGSVSVLVASAAPGAAGNCPAGMTFAVSPGPNGFTSATAVAGGSNGTDLETEAGRFMRFTAYIQTLARGTVAALSYALSTVQITDAGGGITERVALQSIIEPWVLDNTQPVGLVNCFIHNGTGGTSAALVALALQTIQGSYNAAGVGIVGYKAAGVQVTVAAATEEPLAVSGTIKVAPVFAGASAAAAAAAEAALAATAQSALTAYILGLPIGAPYVVAEAYALVMGVPGIVNWLPIAPTADVVSTSATTKLMPGTVQVIPG